jgi:hypothetical protein
VNNNSHWTHIRTTHSDDWENVGVSDFITRNPISTDYLHIRAQLGVQGGTGTMAEKLNRMVTIQVVKPAVAGSILPVDGRVCSGSSFTTALVLSGTGADGFQWYLDSNGAEHAITGATSATLSVAQLANINITRATQFYAKLTNDVCDDPVKSAVATIAVYATPEITEPAKSNVASACTDGGQINLDVEVASAGMATVSYQWYYSATTNDPTAATGWTAFGTNNATQTGVGFPLGAGADDVTINYFVRVFNGNVANQCVSTAVNSDVVSVKWYRPIVATVVTDETGNICQNLEVEATYEHTSNPSSFTFTDWRLINSGGTTTLAGGDNVGDVHTISETLTTLGSNTFRAVVQNGACAAQNIDAAVITVTQAPVATNISRDEAAICMTGTPSTEFSVAGGSVGTVSWQIFNVTTSAWGTFGGGLAGNVASAVTSGGAAARDRFREPASGYLDYRVRALFTMANCDPEESPNEVTVRVYARPTISPTALSLTPALANVCIDEGEIEINAQTNTVVGSWIWQVELPGGSFGDVNGSVATGGIGAFTYDETALVAGTYRFQLRAENGVCDDVFSTPAISIRVWDKPVIGTITAGNPYVCAGSATTTVSVTGTTYPESVSSDWTAEWTINGSTAGVTSPTTSGANIQLGGVETYQVNLRLHNAGCDVSGTAIPIGVISGFTTPLLEVKTTAAVCAVLGNEIELEVSNIDPRADRIEVRRRIGLSGEGAPIGVTQSITLGETGPVTITLTDITTDGNHFYSVRVFNSDDFQGTPQTSCYASAWTAYPGTGLRVNAPPSGTLAWNSGGTAKTLPAGQASGGMTFTLATSPGTPGHTEYGFSGHYTVNGQLPPTDFPAGGWGSVSGAITREGISTVELDEDDVIEFTITLTTHGCPDPFARSITLTLEEANELFINTPTATACLGNNINVEISGSLDVLTNAGTTGFWMWQLHTQSYAGEDPSNLPTATLVDEGPILDPPAHSVGTNSRLFPVTQAGFYHFIFRYSSPAMPAGEYYTMTVLEVFAPSDAGELITKGPYALCQGQGQTLTLDEASIEGDITRWEFSRTGLPDSWTSRGLQVDPEIFTIPTTATAAADSGYYRVVVTSGVCDPAFTTPVKVEIFSPTLEGTTDPAGVVNSCEVPRLLTLENFRGDILGWEFSENNSFGTLPALDIIGGTAGEATHSATDSGYYRAIVKHGACDARATASVRVAIYSPTDPGSLSITSGTASVCQGLTGPTLTLTGHRGGVVEWQYSADSDDGINGDWSNSIANTTNSHIVSTTNHGTRWYRAEVKHGPCSEIHPTGVEITVIPSGVPGHIDVGNTYDTLVRFFGGEFELTIDPVNLSEDFTWEYTRDITVAEDEWIELTGETNLTYIRTNFSGRIWVRARAEGGIGCPRVTNTIEVITYDQLEQISGITGNDFPINDGPAVLKAEFAGSERENPDEFLTIPTAEIEYIWWICDSDALDCSDRNNWTKLSTVIASMPELEISDEGRTLTVQRNYYEFNPDIRYILEVTWPAPYGDGTSVVVGPFGIDFNENLDIDDTPLDYIPAGFEVTIAPTVVGNLPGATYTWKLDGEPLTGAEAWVLEIDNTKGEIKIKTDDLSLHGRKLTLCVLNPGEIAPGVCEDFTLNVLIIPNITLNDVTICEGTAEFEFEENNTGVDWTKFDIKWIVVDNASTEHVQAGTENPLTLLSRTFASHNGNTIRVEITPKAGVEFATDISSEFPIEDDATLTVISPVAPGTINVGNIHDTLVRFFGGDFNLSITSTETLFIWEYSEDNGTTWTVMDTETALTYGETNFSGRKWLRARAPDLAGCPRVTNTIDVRSYDQLEQVSGIDGNTVTTKGEDLVLTAEFAGSERDCPEDIFLTIPPDQIVYTWFVDLGDGAGPVPVTDIPELAGQISGPQGQILTIPEDFYINNPDFKYTLEVTWPTANGGDGSSEQLGPFTIEYIEGLDILVTELDWIPTGYTVLFDPQVLGIINESPTNTTRFTWTLNGTPLTGAEPWLTILDSGRIEITMTNTSLHGSELKLCVDYYPVASEDGPACQDFTLNVLRIPELITLNNDTTCVNGSAEFAIIPSHTDVNWSLFNIAWNESGTFSEYRSKNTLSNVLGVGSRTISVDLIEPTVPLAIDISDDFPISAQGTLVVLANFDLASLRGDTACYGDNAHLFASLNNSTDAIPGWARVFEWFRGDERVQGPDDRTSLSVPSYAPRGQFKFTVSNRWCEPATSNYAPVAMKGFMGGSFGRTPIQFNEVICLRDGEDIRLTWDPEAMPFSEATPLGDIRYTWTINNAPFTGNNDRIQQFNAPIELENGTTLKVVISLDGCPDIQNIVYEDTIRLLDPKELYIDVVGDFICGQGDMITFTAMKPIAGALTWTFGGNEEEGFRGASVFQKWLDPTADSILVEIQIVQDRGTEMESCSAYDYVKVMIPQNIPLAIGARIVDGDTIEYPIRTDRFIVLPELDLQVDLNMLTDNRDGLIFEWNVLPYPYHGNPLLPDYDLEAPTDEEQVRTALFDLDFRAKNGLQYIEAFVRDNSGCETRDTISIRIRGAFSLDTLFVTAVRLQPEPLMPRRVVTFVDTIPREEDQPGTDVDFGNELRVCSGQIVYFTPRITGGTAPFTVRWEADPKSDVYMDDDEVERTPDYFELTDVDSTFADAVIGFKVGTGTTYTLTITDYSGESVTGKIAIGVYEPPYVSLHIAPAMTSVNGFSFYEQQVINIMITPNRFAEYEFWRFIGNDLTHQLRLEDARVDETRQNPFVSSSPVFSTTFPSGTIQRNGLLDDMFISIVGVARDQSGCEASDTVRIRLLPTPSILVPDDINNPLNRVLFPDFDIEVFDTWGLRLQSFGTRGWNATFNGRKVRSGTYYYNVRIPTTTGFETFSGAVTVVRSSDYDQ